MPFGSEVARRLLRSDWPQEVLVKDFGIRGFDLAFALLEGYELTILVDAVSRGGPLGTLYQIEPDTDAFDELKEQDAMIETHGMNPMKVLAMVKSMGGQFKKLLIVGCDLPANCMKEQIGLSAPVEAAVTEAVHMIETIVGYYLQSSDETSNKTAAQQCAKCNVSDSVNHA